MKKNIFLDFDGVMDTGYYDHSLSILGLPQTDKWGVVFDPSCVNPFEGLTENVAIRAINILNQE